ncbi:MAG TPA: DUF3857 domain-containing transglutaminase family protein [Chryseolinea sp.]|nr:DUF3857 domain-containing transglutaminase family protein [Chryseolinea sp.]
MYIKLTVLCISVLICVQAHAVEPKFPVSTISEDLKKGMYAVVREKAVTWSIENKESSVYSERTVVTILSSQAKDLASITIWYDKLRKIESFKAAVYDAEGNLIKRLKMNDLKDQSAISGGTLFDDNRVKYGDLSQTTYPYTVEVEYSLRHKYLYDFGDFQLYDSDGVSAEKIMYTIVYPKELKPRYKLYKIESPLIGAEPDNRQSFKWSFENIKPEKSEKFSPERVVPYILAAPEEFVFEGYAGNMNSWEAYGQWQALVNKGRDVLPEGTKQKIRALTKDLKTPEEKSKAVYEYVQSRTRYVSVQLGIGGLQPFEASVVDQNGYGDCKALSNYTVALLKEVGVRAYYATIMGGNNAPDVIDDFPSDQSNHIVVAVPNGKDTVWLECTSQTNPFGYQGRFTGNRKAMLVTESGGKLVNTTRYNVDQNTQFRHADVIVQANGDAIATVRTIYAGLQYDDIYVDGQYDDQKKWLQKVTSIPSFDIASFSITNLKSRNPQAVINLNLNLKRYASVSGKRIFLAPNLMNRSTLLPEKTEVRRNYVVTRNPYSDADTIVYQLPQGIYPEFLPTPIKLKSRFGEYEAVFTLDQDKLIYTRKIRMFKGQFPAESYNELVEFYRSLNKADNTKMVFLSKT